MDTDTLLKIISLGTGHKWLPLAILLVNWVSALARKESLVPVLNVPARVMPFFVIGLGIVSGVLLGVQDGNLSWHDAVITGAVAAFSSGFIYDVIVKGAFGGFENVPQWLRWLALIPHGAEAQSKLDAAKPAAPKIPPPTGLALLLVGALMFVGCAWFQKHEAQLEDLIAEKAQCALDHVDQTPEQIALSCAIQPGDLQRYMNLVNKQRAYAAKKADEAHARGILEGQHVGCPAPAKVAGAVGDAGTSDAGAVK